MYLQTMSIASKVSRIPIIGEHLLRAIQLVCEKTTGHQPSRTDWGFGGGGRADVWCRWCDKYGSIPIADIEKRFPESRQRIYEATGKDVRNGPVDLG